MRKLLFVIIVLAAVQNWDKISDVFDPPPEIVLNNSEQVVMYGASWCGYCAKARKLFKSQGVPFYEFDIEKSQEGREQYDALKGKGIPLMVINGKVIRGYDKRRILVALQR